MLMGIMMSMFAFLSLSSIEMIMHLNVIKPDEMLTLTSVFCKKDSSEVLQNTILDQLTANLRTINESSLVIEEDTSGFVKSADSW